MSFRKILFTIFAVAMLMSLSIGIVACTPRNSGNNSSEESASVSESASDSQPTSVEPEDIIVVNGVNANANFLLRETAKSEKGDNKETEFMDREQDFFVGDDNAFNVKPSVGFLIFRGDSNVAEAYSPDTWNYVLNVYHLENNNYVLLNETGYESYIQSYDQVNATVDFTEDAIGETFKLEVYPEGLTAKQMSDPDYKSTVEVTVVDGYNAYTASDFVYIEQGGREEATYLNQAWVNYKQQNGYSLDYAPSAVIMQSNIFITPEDLPVEAIWQATDSEINEGDSDYEQVVGSLRDYACLYSRFMKATDKFTLEGNYFTVNITTLPLVVRFRDEISAPGEPHESHASLFRFTSDDATAEQAELADQTDGSGNKASFRNVNFVGNAPRTEDTQLSGGVILLKANKCGFETYNTISNAFVINYMGERSHRPFYITKCRIYDAFTTLVYLFGNSDAKITDSDLNGAGGPAMIIDHVRPLQATDTYPSSMTVVNSEIHSLVTGQEAWFALHGATGAAAIISAMDGAFNVFGKTFTITKKVDENTSMKFMDFIALYKSGSAESMTAEEISGYYKQVATEEDVANPYILPMDFGTYADPWNFFANKGQTPVSMLIEGVLAQNSQAPIFMSSAGGSAIWYPADSSNLLAGGALINTSFQPITDPTDPIFSGNNLYLYYSRMGLVFNYYTIE